MQEEASLPERRLAQARATLEEADTLIAAAQWRGALNRIYYAAFYAARALLAARSLEAKKHSRTIALFQQHFVRTGEIPVDAARALQSAFDERQLADYGEFANPRGEQVLEMREAVAQFVATCAAWVGRHGDTARSADS